MQCKNFRLEQDRFSKNQESKKGKNFPLTFSGKGEGKKEKKWPW